MQPSLLIAIGVLVLYIVLGPLVILGISVYLDRLMHSAQSQGKPENNPRPKEKDPVVWQAKDVHAYLSDRRRNVFDQEDRGK